MWSVLSNFLYPPAAATQLLAYQAGRGQFWPKPGLPNFWQCCGRYSRHPGQGMTSCRGRGFAPAYRVLKPQAQQPRPACWGTPGHQPALELQSISVSPHPSHISLCRLKRLTPNLTYRTVTPSRLPAGQKAHRTCTLSTERAHTTSYCFVPVLRKARTWDTHLLPGGCSVQVEHTDPTDRASSSSLAGAQAGRTPKDMPTDTPPHCSRDVTHTGRKPVGTPGLPPQASSASDIKNHPQRRKGTAAFQDQAAILLTPQQKATIRHTARTSAAHGTQPAEEPQEAASRQMPEDRAVRLPGPPARPITTEVTHCSPQRHHNSSHQTTEVPEEVPYQRSHHSSTQLPATPFLCIY